MDINETPEVFRDQEFNKSLLVKKFVRSPSNSINYSPGNL